MPTAMEFSFYPTRDGAIVGLLHALDADGQRVTGIVKPDYLDALVEADDVGLAAGLALPPSVVLPMSAVGWPDEWSVDQIETFHWIVALLVEHGWEYTTDVMLAAIVEVGAGGRPPG